MHPFRTRSCGAPCPFDPEQLCPLPVGHRGLHTVTLTWGAGADDADTMKLPPIRDSIGHRRRPPALSELADRAELLEAMGRELQRELRELREDQGDDDAGPGICGSMLSQPDGIEWICGREPDHRGPHEVHGRKW